MSPYIKKVAVMGITALSIYGSPALTPTTATLHAKEGFAGDATAGQMLFRTKACFACHAYEEDRRAATGNLGPFLGGIGAKRGANWLDAYLADPMRVFLGDDDLKNNASRYPSRMVPIPLTAEERAHLVKFLSGL